MQRLRELLPNTEELDDETLRDQLDEALGEADDSGRAVRTLDAMLGEPQTLIPVARWGEILWAIVKEDTVVTVLPRSHGEEILQRGQALQQRVASGRVQIQHGSEEGWEGGRRRWRREPGAPVVVERSPRRADLPAAADPSPAPRPATPKRPERPKDPVGALVFDALRLGERRAAATALREFLAQEDADADLAPVLQQMQESGMADALRVSDLLSACIAAVD